MNSEIDSTSIKRKVVPTEELGRRIAESIRMGWRFGHLTAKNAINDKDYPSLNAILFRPDRPSIEVWESKITNGSSSFPSITPDVPSAHWFERFIYDLFGLVPDLHPRFKSVIFHAGWPAEYFPLTTAADVPPSQSDKPRDYGFLPVHGDGVFEIAVGPIHAGIIEPGHFRFSCLGEDILNLDIRLGYLHRGIEKRLTSANMSKVSYLAEAISTDTVVGNALAHAQAVESLLGVTVSESALILRTCALETERIACHLGDLGGICSDLGFYVGAAALSRLRGTTLGAAERLTGSRFMTSFIRPGGVSRGLTNSMCQMICHELEDVQSAFDSAMPVLLDNFGALDRMEGTGVLRPGLARDLGVVGPVGRASGVKYDVREYLQLEPYVSQGWKPAYADEGDILARVRVRSIEVAESLQLILKLLSSCGKWDGSTNSDIGARFTLPPGQVGVGVVESWRGELIHTIFTDENGQIDRYAIKDASMNNWPGLAHAVRGATVSDFPLCNKSFSLSYSGNDL